MRGERNRTRGPWGLLLAAVLVAVLCAGLSPVRALAEDVGEQEPYEAAATSTDWDLTKYSTARGSLGFFEYLNDVKGIDTSYALYELTGGTEPYTESNGETLDAAVSTQVSFNGETFIDHTNIGADGDATSLENMRAAIEWIRVSNECRALFNADMGLTPENPTITINYTTKSGKAKSRTFYYREPLLISNLEMAQSQISANEIAAYGKVAHSGYGSGENAWFGWDNMNPFDGWYTKEKDIFDRSLAGENVSGETGHFQQLVSQYSDITGFAVTQNGTGNYPTIIVQHFNHIDKIDATKFPEANENFWEKVDGMWVTWYEKLANNGSGITKLFTVDEYQALFEDYYAHVKAAEAGNATDIGSATVSVSDVTYTGRPCTPNPTVTLGGTTLRSGTDYTVSYSGNTNAGTATVTVTGKGNYTGTATGTFAISPASLSAASVTAPSQTYTGGALSPAPTVTLGGVTLKSGTDYTVSYSGNTNVGTATVTVTGKGNYTGTATGTFAIAAAPGTDLSGATVAVADQTYTGSALKPAPTVTLGGATLRSGTDYTVAYKNNTGVGAATVTVTGTGGYTGTASRTFTIKPASLSGAAVAAADQTYTGKALKPAPTVTLGSVTLVAGTDYTAAYGSNVNAGTATVTVTGKGNYTGTATGTFAIEPASLAKATVTCADRTYTGSALRPALTVKLGSVGLRSGTDYTAAYGSNTNAGTANVTVTGRGNYTGTATGTFTISPASLSAASVTAPSQTYTGSALRPAPTVTLGGATLRSGTDYTVSYGNNTSVGTATVTVTGRGNYTGTATGIFEIAAAPRTDLSGAAVAVADQTYTGGALRPAPTVTLGSATLRSGTDYTVSYSGNTNVGTATVTVTGKGNYTGSATGSFAIAPASLAKATVTCADRTYTGGALSPAPTVTLGSVTLVAGTDYTAAYGSNVNAGTANVTITGRGNYTGTAKGSFAIAPASLSAASVTAPNQTYTGSALMPAPTVTLGGVTLKSGTDYTVAYKNNTSVGTATVTVTGKGNYTGTAKGTFSITEKPARRSWKRLWGQGSLDTMEAIVKEGWSGTGGTVVVARNDDFKDALAACGLAGLHDAPIVLTAKGSLSEQAERQIRRLAPTRVFVAGGKGAVSDAVVNRIAAITGLGVEDENTWNETGVIRLWGQGSPETSAALANAGWGEWEGGIAIIATNSSFKDALSAAPISYAMHWPILLASGGRYLSDDVLRMLYSLGVDRVYIVGGEGAVKPHVQKQLGDAGIEVAGRIWGQTGWQTSREIAKWGLSLGLSADGMGYATSQKFPDALAGAALIGRGGGVLLLADQAAQGNLKFAKDHASEITHGYVFGGEGAFSKACYGQLPK